ncbi:MAG: ferritin family protein [Spirochaetes bacterium]|jgi:rubrerythrin|nr:ferritin family protein [Spirochaetota bacterium]
MDLNFSPDEILKLAEQIEKNGIKFYTRAAEETKGKTEIKEQFLKLADMERAHEKVFTSMLYKLGEKRDTEIHDPEGHVVLYFKAWVDRQIFDDNGRLAEILIKNRSMVDILKIAIGLERDSILFYLGMKEMTEIEDSQQEIDTVIKEEMKHIAYLIKELEKYQS